MCLAIRNIAAYCIRWAGVGLVIGGLFGCQPALLKVQTPPAPACPAQLIAPAALPEKPHLPEVMPTRANCSYALCLDEANYRNLLERIRLLEADDNEVRSLYANQQAALARACGMVASSTR